MGVSVLGSISWKLCSTIVPGAQLFDCFFWWKVEGLQMFLALNFLTRKKSVKSWVLGAIFMKSTLGEFINWSVGWDLYYVNYLAMKMTHNFDATTNNMQYKKKMQKRLKGNHKGGLRMCLQTMKTFRKLKINIRPSTLLDVYYIIFKMI